MQTTEKVFRVQFVSTLNHDRADSWVVHLHFPPNSGPSDELPIEAIDGTGAPITGEFEFMGRKCPIKDGNGAILYADFIAGIHNPAIWMYRPGREPVPGGLTFV